jgi:hypothetical protein
MKTRVFLLLTSIVLVAACETNNSSKIHTEKLNVNETSLESAPMPVDPTIPNYCKGCGESKIESDGCRNQICRAWGEPGGCPLNIADSLGLEAQVTFDFGLIEAYEVRDSFLIKTEKGQDYISHFYEFGNYLFEEDLINILNIVDFVSFGQSVYEAVSELRTGNAGTIVLDSQLKASCMHYVNLIRSNNPPTYIVNRLDMVEADLNLFENKSRSFILAHL